MKETHMRSLSKGVLWRIISIVVLAIITYVYTRDLLVVTLVTAISNVTFLLIYYIHERLWLRIQRPTGKVQRSIAKMFTYITLCGVITMSTITYFVTGSLEAMAGITLTYVVIKHILYICNELIWEKISWGSELKCRK
jgi:uncharacterized membrane protein